MLKLRDKLESRNLEWLFYVGVGVVVGIGHTSEGPQKGTVPG
jgi:hypothetical protein